jgi:hypothetical protein
MTALKKPEIIVHSIFEEWNCDLEEVVDCIRAFLNGDPGNFEDQDDEVIGFMNRSLKGLLRHGVYDTRSGGLVHVVGDNEKIMAMPDIVFAAGTKQVDCSINTCTCDSDHTQSMEKAKPTKNNAN